ncbi:hypothetical protein FOA52_011095 [Chlamydomonas sp. UWO 241]|nr:hypothetical protein FOA52_011095 [Chlamydomonas sp. UWO 241]
MASISTLAAGPVRVALDEHALMEYLMSSLPPGVLPPSPQLASLRQFGHGQSNPTLLATITPAGGSTSDRSLRLVVRKKPAGKILASAHAVEREYQVIAALHGSPVPVPRPLTMCHDAVVLGTPFYVMEHAAGTVYLDPNLPGLGPGVRQHLYAQMASCLARLHSLDPRSVHLGNFGSAPNYCARQVRRWASQYAASVDTPMPEVSSLIEWLKANVPAEDADTGPGSICHGDYRLDNLVVNAGAGHQVTAILDWELSTLGNAWADVAYNCLPYHLPRGTGGGGLPALSSPLPPGVPTEEAYVQWYCAARDLRPPPPQEWAFYLALSLFRLLAILAGVQARARAGNASSASAASIATDDTIRALAGAARRVIQRGMVSSSTSSISGGGGGADTGAATPGGFRIDGLSARVRGLRDKLVAFMDEHVFPAEEVFEAHAAGPDRWTVHPLMEQLKSRAKEQGLWNLWLPGAIADKVAHLGARCADADEAAVVLGPRLNNLEYAHLCEVTGRSPWAPEVFNCGAPDTGNMEVLAKYGTEEQQVEWLLPLLRGEIRSCFAMTEKAVASSDATNIQSSIVRQADGSYLLTGLKWWTSGACDPRCKVAIFMGKTDPSAKPHAQQSMVLVPFDAPGVRVVRPMLVYGYDDAPHGHAEVDFSGVVVPSSSLILGEGRGFEIAQGRLGPGRLHHCMRLVGAAERALGVMCERALTRTAFGGPLARQGALRADLARCRIDIDSARLLVLAAAAALDSGGFKAAMGPIAAAKVHAPAAALRVIDAAIQVHGGAGVCQDFMLARLWTHARTLRIADGPDEVHLGTLAKLELAKHHVVKSKL